MREIRLARTGFQGHGKQARARQVLVDDIKSITKNKSADLQRQVDILTSTEHLSHMLDEGSSKTGGKM